MSFIGIYTKTGKITVDQTNLFLEISVIFTSYFFYFCIQLEYIRYKTRIVSLNIDHDHYNLRG